MEGIVTPNVKKKLNLRMKDSRFCHYRPSGNNEFEITDGGSRFVMNLTNRTCCCKVWDGTGIPCKHATSAIKHIRGDIETYCDPFYSVERYRLTYGHNIHPIPDLQTLEVDGMTDIWQPPHFRRLPGRPRRNRRKANGEGEEGDHSRKRASTVRCDSCKQLGHNKRTCQRAPVKKKGVSSSQRVGGKSKQMTEEQGSDNNSQRVTRSQISTAPSQVSLQEKQRERMAKKAAWIKARRATRGGMSTQ